MRIFWPMASLRVCKKCSRTNVYAPLFRKPAPCPEPKSTHYGTILYLFKCKNIGDVLKI